MNTNHKIIVISGPSGSGKTTVVKALLDRFRELSFSVSATTRKKRINEKDKKDYYFLTPEEFKKKIINNELLEYEEVYPGIFYGTLRTEIDRIILSGKIPVLDVDVKGAMNIKKSYGKSAMTVFLHPESTQILEKRLKKRKSETASDMKERLQKANSELGYTDQFDHIVFNNKELNETIRQVRELLMNFISQKK